MTGPDADGALRRACEWFAAGEHGRAIEACRRLTQRSPRNAELQRQLALMLTNVGRFDEAVYAARRAVELDSGRADCRATLGGVLLRAGRTDDAAGPLAEAVRLDPAQSGAWGDLAMVHLSRRRHDEALEACEAGLRASPMDGAIRLNAAMLRLETADAGRAIDELRALRRDAPGQAVVLQALASAMNYTVQDPREVLEAHAAWGRMLPAEKNASDFAPGRGAGGPLRVAFISPDLYDHSVSYFLEPLLRGRDRAAMQVMCVHTGRAADEMTRRLRSLADEWIDAAGMDEGALVRRLRDARPDVAIDLCGLFLGNSLGALARRVAPLQATWMGYPNTTGVPAIDLRIVDATTDPAGAEGLATERLARLEGCFLCYGPPADEPEVAARGGGPVTFGSFNAVKKISAEAVRAWSRVLREAPGSRMVLKGGGFSSRRARETVLGRFRAEGVDPSRVELRGHEPGKAAHLRAYSDIDIALDTFPYHGTTTTCEALWMGVPVVTLAGRVHASRVGASLLTAAGLAELVAADEDGFARIAGGLAGDGARRARLRGELRSRVAGSALCDAAGFAQRFEKMLREIWVCG